MKIFLLFAYKFFITFFAAYFIMLTDVTGQTDDELSGNITFEKSLKFKKKNGEQTVMVNVSGSTEFTGTLAISASMQKPKSGSFSIEYPKGNTLNSFPGSIPIKVIYNNLPKGDYTMKVEAKSTDGKPINPGQLDFSTKIIITWAGGTSSSWFNSSNWSPPQIPTDVDNVVIPSGTLYQPEINNGEYAYCNNLTIESGATLTQYGQSILSVYGYFNSDQGTFTQSGQAFIYFRGSSKSWDDDNEDDTYQYVYIDKDPGSNLSIWQDMTVEESFVIREGNFQIDNTWTLTVNGAGSGAFEVESGGKLTLNDESIHIVNGDCTFEDGSQANVNGGTIRCGGDFTIDNNSGYNIQFNGGELIMDGSGSQSIEINDAGSYIFNLITDKPSGTCTLNSAELQINNDFTINNGTFDANGNDIFLWDDWTNNVGLDGFIEGTGRVSFWGPGSNTQHIYTDEKFNILENHTYSALNIDGDITVECNSYDWTTGGLNVSQATFIVNDLADDGIFGDFTASNNAEIYLNQDASQINDLFSSNISISDNSIFKITGGNFGSDWCTINPLTLEINSGGIFDIEGTGITIHDDETFTYSINGGTIKSSGWFGCQRNDFNPIGGTIELYGGGSANIAINSGSNVYNLLINKSIGTTISLADDIVVANDLTIQNGILNSSGNDIYVGNNWTNNVGLDGFIESSGKVSFNGGNVFLDQKINTSEKFNVLECNTIPGIGIDGAITVECESYKRTSGGLSVSQGTFIANDLADDGIYGDYSVSDGGEIYLTQDGSQSIDFKGNTGNDILIGENSIIKITGGADISEWCNYGPLNINIGAGGILDFDGPGIDVYDDETLTISVNDGTIRTSGSFICYNTDFNLTSGTFELYGDEFVTIDLIPGSSVYDLLINKSGDDKSGDIIGDPENKSQKSSKGGTVWLDGNVYISNDFVLSQGFMEALLFPQEIHVGGDWLNAAGPSAFIEDDITVIFNGPNSADIPTEETFYNLVLDKSYTDFDALEVFENVNVNNNLHIIDGSFELNEPCTLTIGKNVTIENYAGLNANDIYGPEIHIGGNWTNYNTGYFQDFGFLPGNSTVIFNSDQASYITTNAPKEDFWNLIIDKEEYYSKFGSNDDFQVFGNFLMSGGLWDDTTSGLSYTFYGDFEVTGGGWNTGSFENTLIFTGSNDQQFFQHSINNPFKDVIINKTPADYMVVSDPDQNWTKKIEQKEGDNLPTLILMSNMILTDDGILSIDQGALEINGNRLRGDGDIAISEGGKLSLNSNSTLQMGDGSELSVFGGLLETIGTPGNMAHITSYSGYYGFSVANGGMISAEYTKFEYTNISGVNVKGDGLVDTIHSFNYCTFLNGPESVRYLQIKNNQTLNCYYVNFPEIGDNQFNVSKEFTNLGLVNMVNATGSFQGEDYEFDVFNRINWTYTNSRDLDLTVFIEGPFNNSTNMMNTEINSIIPLNQPFDDSPLGNFNPRWSYYGPESVVSIPNPDIVDWVLVELRNAEDIGEAESSTAIFTRAAFLTNTGQVVDLDGVSPLTFTYSPVFNLYAIIWHRNHLGIISANPLVEDNGTFNYDFSSSVDQTYGGIFAQTLLSGSPEIWGMKAGDANGSGNIIYSDKQTGWNTLVGESGYLEADFNLDGEVDNRDKNEYWLLNLNHVTGVPY